ncbi:MAG: hypothetical protein MKZ92_12215, partial [Pedosphaera sp.]|nr:hypothetical protein [Pedosphaera sp.]
RPLFFAVFFFVGALGSSFFFLLKRPITFDVPLPIPDLTAPAPLPTAAWEWISGMMRRGWRMWV